MVDYYKDTPYPETSCYCESCTDQPVFTNPNRNDGLSNSSGINDTNGFKCANHMHIDTDLQPVLIPKGPNYTILNKDFGLTEATYFQKLKKPHVRVKDMFHLTQDYFMQALVNIYLSINRRMKVIQPQKKYIPKRLLITVKIMTIMHVLMLVRSNIILTMNWKIPYLIRILSSGVRLTVKYSKLPWIHTGISSKDNRSLLIVEKYLTTKMIEMK